MTCPYVIETHDLSKRYGRVDAVKDLSLTVRAEQITGYLGRNGAGKTTSIKMLLGMTHPTAGGGTCWAGTSRASRKAVKCVAVSPTSPRTSSSTPT